MTAVPLTRYDSNMHSIQAPPEVAAAFDAFEAAEARIRELSFEALSPAVRLRALERMETSRRRQIAWSHDVIAGLAEEDPADVGGPVHKVVADWLRISCAEACRRLRDVKQLSSRLTLTGQELPPELPATAQAWRDGLLDGQHLRVIQTFVRDLPEDVPVDTVAKAERFLARQAVKLRPDQLEKVAHQCALRINPDGKFSDSDRARQRGFTWCWSARRRDEHREAGGIPGIARQSRCVAGAVRGSRHVQPGRSNPLRRRRTHRGMRRQGHCAAMPSASTTRSTPWSAASWAIRSSVCTTDYRSPS